jgi:ABC-type dipeptide/oligopeptide/nickel transport system permease subunit
MTASTKERTTPQKPSLSPTADALLRLRRNPVAVVCGLYIVLIVSVAVFANVVAPYDYDFQDIKRYTSTPAPPDALHRLGTDDVGRDVLSRLIYGARVSLGITAFVLLLEAGIGITLGLIAGYKGGRIDLLIGRFIDVMFAFPDLLLAILLMAIVRSGDRALPFWVSTGTLCLALGVVGWPGMARLVRGQALALREKEFIEAARAIGLRDSTIIRRHVFPNLLSPIIVQATQDIATIILAEATISFLGIGVQKPFPSWGQMIADALQYKETKSYLLIAPVLALALTVMAFNFFGDALRDAFDPRLRQ